jgi:putative ABC transport system permease protein
MLGIEAVRVACFPGKMESPGSECTVILSYALWQKRFASGKQIIGNAIMLNGNSYTVVGMLPAAFRFRGVEIDIAIR